MDFPGTVTLRWNVFVESLLDQRPLADRRTASDRILIVNGHGSNIPLVNMAARLLNVEHRGAVCMSSFYLDLGGVGADARGGPHDAARRDGARVRARDLALPRDRARARPDGQGGRREIPDSYTEHAWMDWSDGPLAFTPHWSALTESGVTGDATAATAEPRAARCSTARRRRSRRSSPRSRSARVDPGRDHH